MWYALFVGLPLLCAIVIGPFTAPIGYKGLIQKQFPPKGFKVFKPTKIIRGWKSSLMSVIQLLIPIVLIIFSIWGYFQVDKMPSKAPENIDYSVCKN